MYSHIFCFTRYVTQEETLNILKTGANVFLTGEPGSGKTHTVNRYVSWLSERAIEPAITASTGIAATHIGGYTIHSWSGIGIKQFLTDYDLDQIGQNKRIVDQVSGAHVLIIDEVSMLAAKTLSMVDAVCRTIKRDERPFGGIQVVLVGDFFQLPPVQRRNDFEEESQELFEDRQSLFSFGSPAWERLSPIVCYLHEQHRQEDSDFLDVLSAMRRNALTAAHRVLLRTRFNAIAGEETTKLYSHNEDVDRINDTAIAKLTSDARVFSMTSVGPDRLVINVKKGCLSPEVLTLKVGARVMFTKNDVQTQRFVNGTLGKVTGFASESGNPIVKTHDGRTLVVEPEDWSVQDGKRILASITQLPLRLAWAMTVHKSQGMSLDAAHMDLSHAFEYGQGYVALSRVRTLSGLSLAGLNERALQVHPEILEKDIIFRENSEAATEAFGKLSEAELAGMHANFVKASGGHEPSGTVEAKVPVAVEKSTLHAVREKFPNAYRPWTAEHDGELAQRFEKGEKLKDIAKVFGRQPGSIHARLLKLGLIEEEV